MLFHHIGLTVRDMQQIAAFFQSMFGFVPTDAALPGATQSRITLRAPNCAIELAEYDSIYPASIRDRPVNEAGITHFCIQTRHITAIYENLAGTGTRSNAPPTTLPTGIQYLYVCDPEANVIEIEGLGYAPTEQLPWIGHVAIATHNIERLANFYHRLLGGERRGGQKIGPHPLYDQITGLQNVEVIPTWIAGANITLELWQYLNPPTLPRTEPRALTEPGYSHLCLEVDHLDKTLGIVTESGGQIVNPVHGQDSINVALVRDPDGNLLELAEIPTGHGWSVRELRDPQIVQRVEALRPVYSTTM